MSKSGVREGMAVKWKTVKETRGESSSVANFSRLGKDGDVMAQT